MSDERRYTFAPHDAMIDQLRVDYRAMQGMIFGDPPDFEAVLASINSLETRLNNKGSANAGRSDKTFGLPRTS